LKLWSSTTNPNATEQDFSLAATPSTSTQLVQEKILLSLNENVRSLAWLQCQELALLLTLVVSALKIQCAIIVSARLHSAETWQRPRIPIARACGGNALDSPQLYYKRL
jgi:hypothetical protein